MIHLIFATFLEAKPFIKFYKLKRNMKINEFEIFINQRMKISLTISGIGKLLSACAVVFTYSHFKKRNSIWINIGIAGVKDAELGKLFLIDKINDTDNNTSFYPFCLFKTDIEKKDCKTFSEPNFEYTSSIHDMELSGFYLASLKFSTNELIHAFKIISDNKNEKINFKNVYDVANLMENNIKEIDKFIDKLSHMIQSHTNG